MFKKACVCSQLFWLLLFFDCFPNLFCLFLFRSFGEWDFHFNHFLLADKLLRNLLLRHPVKNPLTLLISQFFFSRVIWSCNFLSNRSILVKIMPCPSDRGRIYSRTSRLVGGLPLLFDLTFDFSFGHPRETLFQFSSLLVREYLISLFKEIFLLGTLHLIT